MCASDSDNSARPVIAVVLKGYPRLSETFIAQEILALERCGLDLRLVSLRQPTDASRHPIHAEIRAPVRYLPEYLHRQPVRVLRAWWRVRRYPGYARAVGVWRRDLRRDRSRNRIRRFGQALVLASELEPEVGHLHAHFIHTPASVARYAAIIVGLPWSVSAHAKDIWTSPEWEIREKLACCAWLVTCTAANHRYLSRLSNGGDRVSLVYHGLDFERFPAPPPRSRADGPVVLLSVGRAVPKKGYEVLLQALARLPEKLDWRLIHIGGGPLLERLRQRGEALGLASRVSWRGALPQQAVLAAYRQADLFVLASRVVEDGDRDGLPNVLMEAQSQRLACVSTWVSGIPELIEDGVTGLLVAPDDCGALADTLQRLIENPGLRRELGERGFERVRRHFSHHQGIADLMHRLRPGGTQQ